MSELWNIEVLEFFNSRFEYRIINQSKINSTQKSRNSVRSNYSKKSFNVWNKKHTLKNRHSTSLVEKAAMGQIGRNSWYEDQIRLTGPFTFFSPEGKTGLKAWTEAVVCVYRIPCHVNQLANYNRRCWSFVHTGVRSIRISLVNFRKNSSIGRLLVSTIFHGR